MFIFQRTYSFLQRNINGVNVNRITEKEGFGENDPERSLHR